MPRGRLINVTGKTHRRVCRVSSLWAHQKRNAVYILSPLGVVGFHQKPSPALLGPSPAGKIRIPCCILLANPRESRKKVSRYDPGEFPSSASAPGLTLFMVQQYFFFQLQAHGQYFTGCLYIVGSTFFFLNHRPRELQWDVNGARLNHDIRWRMTRGFDLPTADTGSLLQTGYQRKFSTNSRIEILNTKSYRSVIFIFPLKYVERYCHKFSTDWPSF